jgi:hypothetical protein
MVNMKCVKKGWSKFTKGSITEGQVSLPSTGILRGRVSLQNWVSYTTSLPVATLSQVGMVWGWNFKAVNCNLTPYPVLDPQAGGTVWGQVGDWVLCRHCWGWWQERVLETGQEMWQGCCSFVCWPVEGKSTYHINTKHYLGLASNLSLRKYTFS